MGSTKQNNIKHKIAFIKRDITLFSLSPILNTLNYVTFAIYT